MHERPRAGQDPREPPTLDDYLVRYVKCLVWWTMDRHCSHVAVALGCFLYAYWPGDPVPLAPAFFPRTLSRVRTATSTQERPGLAAPWCDDLRASDP